MKQWEIVWNLNGIKDSFGFRSGMDSKTVLELEWNQRQFQNQDWDGFKYCFGIGMESKTVLESGVGWIQRLFWNWN